MLCPTSPSLLRNATSPSRRGFGSQGEVSRFAKVSVGLHEYFIAKSRKSA